MYWYLRLLHINSKIVDSALITERTLSPILPVAPSKSIFFIYRRIIISSVIAGVAEKCESILSNMPP